MPKKKNSVVVQSFCEGRDSFFLLLKFPPMVLWWSSWKPLELSHHLNQWYSWKFLNVREILKIESMFVFTYVVVNYYSHEFVFFPKEWLKGISCQIFFLNTYFLVLWLPHPTDMHATVATIPLNVSGGIECKWCAYLIYGQVHIRLVYRSSSVELPFLFREKEGWFLSATRAVLLK